MELLPRSSLGAPHHSWTERIWPGKGVAREDWTGFLRKGRRKTALPQNGRILEREMTEQRAVGMKSQKDSGLLRGLSALDSVSLQHYPSRTAVGEGPGVDRGAFGLNNALFLQSLKEA